jgi:hypothetical protein
MGMKISQAPHTNGLKNTAPILGHDYCDTLDRLCSTFLLLTMTACVCSARLPQSQSLPFSPEPTSPFFVLLHRGPVPGYPEGIWPWACATFPDFQADIVFLRLHSEHVWCWCVLDLSDPRKFSSGCQTCGGMMISTAA